MGQSKQVMLIRNYQFSNPDQEGNQSNTGIEAYMFGAPRPDKLNWCTSCRLTLKILDSVLEHAVIGTDGYGFALNDRGGGPHDLIVDLGGGVLGSRGHNLLLDNGKGPLRVAGHRVTARHNWWDGGVPVAHGPDDRVAPEAEVLTEPVLTEDPG